MGRVIIIITFISPEGIGNTSRKSEYREKEIITITILILMLIIIILIKEKIRLGYPPSR